MLIPIRFLLRRLQMLTTDDQELKRLGMAGMSTANKKFDSFFVSSKRPHRENLLKVLIYPAISCA